MAKIKTTPRKVECFGNSSGKNMKTKVNCLKCNKKFASISSLRRHHRSFHEPTVEIYECIHCPATFTRKYSAKKHIADKHKDEVLKDFITKNETPRANAKPVQIWRPPMEARTIDWNKTKPVFKIKPAPPKYGNYDTKKIKSNPEQSPNYNTLADDLYLSSDSDDDCIYIKTTQPTYTTNEFGYICEPHINDLPYTMYDTQPSCSKYEPTYSDSSSTICLDELPEEFWDRQVTVKGIYNIFTA